MCAVAAKKGGKTLERESQAHHSDQWNSLA